ncbi:actinobacterial surface-anchored protein domain [Corynebacterium mustelae]|uniref:Actinobacterial surface-anchored protein domain n=1 Tax=Corynebacterium mustelae TaxID=571915 RepID=A0A0G3H0Q2_9CORY|nr:choice-of-anchor M domain-containing protein [Corynebacterium mustelae]AKK05403.1 actinobacterial surface-anchored protein domain [Corynebacterium mustelae]
MSRSITKIMAALTVSAVIFPSAAHAGPDDGKTVITRTHVDSPKTFWDPATKTFDQKTSAGNDVLHEFDSSVIYLGKGWSRRGKNQYQFTIPDDGHLTEVGAPGDVFYAGPSNVIGPYPLWWGFGAGSLPLNDFQNDNVVLELVDVDGPGEVHFFTHYDNYPAGLRKFLGSTAQSTRIWPLTSGDHTHNTILFTKPGRHIITYRTIAKLKDGTTVESGEKRQTVQVGGTEPRKEASQSLEERYAAAPEGNLAEAGYELSIAPYKPAQPKEGDKNLELVKFQAKDTSVSGTLTLLNDGYHLADIDVVNGYAEWPDLFGAKTSMLQAVFIPATESGARWISPVISRSFLSSHTVSSEQNPGQLVAPTKNPANVRFSSPASLEKDATVSVEIDDVPGSSDFAKLTVTVDDPSFTGLLRGGFADKYTDTVTTDPAEAPILNGRAEFFVERESIAGRYPKLKIIPHPTHNALTATIAPEQQIPEAGSLTLPSGTITRAPKSADTSPNDPSNQSHRCGEQWLLASGHTDLEARRDGDAFTMTLLDQTNTEGFETYRRKVSDVINVVRDNALSKREKGLAKPELDFLVPVGEKFYHLPQNSKQDILWPGYNTERLNYEEFSGSVDLHLEPITMPNDAIFGVFSENGLAGDIKVLANSAAKDHVIETDLATHAHVGWAFTKPGVYRFKTFYKATMKDGTDVSSAPETMTFVVGAQPGTECQQLDNSQTPPANDGSAKLKGGHIAAIVAAIIGVIAAVAAAVLSGPARNMLQSALARLRF